MQFLVDAQLPPALAKALRDAGFRAKHVYELGMVAAPDKLIWKRALDDDFTVITKDEDFVALRNMRRHGPAVIWLRVGNTGNRSLIPWLLRLMPEIVMAIRTGDSIVELRQ